MLLAAQPRPIFSLSLTNPLLFPHKKGNYARKQYIRFFSAFITLLYQQHPTIRNSTKKTTTATMGFQESEETFPFQLYDALQKATELDLRSVSWVQNGTRFMVHDRDLFVKEVLPRHFSGQSQFKSFQRQLNLYGFLRTKKGPLKGMFFPSSFKCRSLRLNLSHELMEKNFNYLSNHFLK